MIDSHSLSTVRLTWVACIFIVLAACKEQPAPPSDADKAKDVVSAPASTPEEPAPKEPVEEAKGDNPYDQLGPGTRAQQQLLVRAKSRFLNHDIAGAEPLFEELAGSSPISSPQVSAALALGSIYESSERSDEALALYRSLLDRVGPIPEVNLMVGRAFAAQGSTKEALSAFERVLEVQPLYIFLWVEIGQLHASSGDKEKGAEALLNYERKLYTMADQVRAPDQIKVEDRLQIIEVFSFIEDDKVTMTLIEVLAKDPESDVRAAAARAIGETMAVSARPALQERQKVEQSDLVQRAIRDALAQLAGIAEPGVGDVASPTFVNDESELPE